MPVLRILGAIVLGLLTGGVVVFVVQIIGVVVYPLPEGFDPYDHEQNRQRMINAPLVAKVVLWAAWTLGAGAGTLVSTLVAGRRFRWWGLVIGLAIAAGTVSVLLQYPGQGALMWILGTTLPLLASGLVCRVAHPTATESGAPA